MSPERMPIPPIGKRPSSGEVDLGTGMYLMAGVHSSEETSEGCSVVGSDCATTGVCEELAEKATDADETGATDDEDAMTAEDSATLDKASTALDARTVELDTAMAELDAGTAELDAAIAELIAGSAELETATDDKTGAAEEAGTLPDATDCTTADEAGTSADDTATDG